MRPRSWLVCRDRSTLRRNRIARAWPLAESGSRPTNRRIRRPTDAALSARSLLGSLGLGFIRVLLDHTFQRGGQHRPAWDVAATVDVAEMEIGRASCRERECQYG